MKFRPRIKFVILFFLLIFFVSGCKIINLISIKNQMADQKNFKVTDEDGLSLTFTKPLMNKKYITWLMSTEPTIKNSDVWIYEIKKRYRGNSRDKKNFDIPIKLNFENNKLKVATLPKRFTQHIPKSMFAKSIQSFGKGRLIKRNKTLHAVYKVNDKSEFLSTRDIIAFLGLPYYTKVEGEEESFVFIYKILSPDVNKKVGVRYNYNFNRKTKLLNSITAKIKGFNILIEFTESQDENLPK